MTLNVSNHCTPIALLFTFIVAAVAGLLAPGCGGSSPASPASPSPQRCGAGITASLQPPTMVGLAAYTKYTFTGGGSCSSYSWDLGDGTTAQGGSVLHTFSSSGQFTVTLAGAGPAGTETTTQAVVVKSLTGVWRGTCNATPVITFTLTLTQSGKDFTREYTDDRGGPGTDSWFLFAENWDGKVYFIQMNFLQPSHEIGFGGTAASDLNSFSGNCVPAPHATPVSFTMTRQ